MLANFLPEVARKKQHVFKKIWHESLLTRWTIQLSCHNGAKIVSSRVVKDPEKTDKCVWVLVSRASQMRFRMDRSGQVPTCGLQERVIRRVDGSWETRWSKRSHMGILCTRNGRRNQI